MLLLLVAFSSLQTKARSQRHHPSQISLAWSAPPTLGGYALYWSTTQGGPYPNVREVGLIYSYELTGLTPGTTYYFTVQAYDTSLNLFGCLLAEQNGVATAQGQLQTTWPQPSAIVGYTLLWGTQSGKYTNNTNAGTQLAATVTGLVSGTTYYFTVHSYDVQGNTSCNVPEVSSTAP
jgi:hypothetical protein